VKRADTAGAYAHESEQIATVVSGRLRFRLDDEECVLAAGKSLVIAGHRPHGVEALEDSVVLDVFAPRREDWFRGDDAYLRG
jgi:unsaturated pyranuronate lyase